VTGPNGPNLGSNIGRHPDELCLEAIGRCSFLPLGSASGVALRRFWIQCLAVDIIEMGPEQAACDFKRPSLFFFNDRAADRM
jgi:hypothetical protein